MGLLSRFPYFLQGVSPPNGITPFVTPQQEEGGQGPAFAPQQPPMPQTPETFAPKQAPQQGWGERLNNWTQSPLFTLGMSLLGNAQGSNWQGVGQDMRAYGQQRMLQQRMDNETRRQKAGDARDEQQFGWAQQAHDQAEQQRQRYSTWAAGQTNNPMASVNPEAAYDAQMEADAAAHAPITPYQQAQLDLERHGQQLSYNAQMANINRDRPMRGPDATLLNDVREADARFQGLNQLGDQFLAANGVQGTGELSHWNPLNFVNPERAGMRQTSSSMRAYMRPPGSGATSDYEQRLYAMGVPSVDNTGPQNQEIMRNIRAAGQIASQRRNFYEAYASEHGNLNGAEQAFQRSPEFRQIVRSNPVNAPGGGGERAPAPQQRGYDTLPSPRGMREGQIITDTQTGRRFILRNGAWQPMSTGNAGGRPDGPMRRG